MSERAYRLQTLGSYVRRRKAKTALFAVLVFAVVAYGLAFFVPKRAVFSYAGAACVGQFTLLPSLQRESSERGLTPRLDGALRVGSFDWASTKTCIDATARPQAGTTTLAVSPFGLPVFKKHYAVTVPDAPSANVSVLTKSIPATKALTVPMNKDTVHDYNLTIAGKNITCDSTDKTLTCDIASLKLTQGATYDYALTRSFEGRDSRRIAQGKLTTLQAVKVTDASIKPNQIMYDRSKTFRIVSDKTVSNAKVDLKQGESSIPTTVTIEKNAVVVTLKDELAREKPYELRLARVDATDGSELVEPYVAAFTTSGGPKIANVSVGAVDVPQGATITLTFDQNVSKTADITKSVKINGIPATVRKSADNQVSVALGASTLCQPFSMTVDKGVLSEYDLASAEAWSYQGRIRCYSSFQYGTSVRGRPLMAYAFGNGSKRIMFTGGIHGNEVSTVTTMNAWVEYLKSTAHELPAGTQVIVAPNVNPDGISAATRYNARNVNLGRNFPSRNWQADATTSRGNEKGVGGSSPGSEPETKALMNLTAQYRPRLEVSFHSQGRLVGANKYADSVAIGNTYARLVGYGTMYDNAEDVMGYSITGEYEEWLGETYGTPAILIELPSHGGNYLAANRAALLQMTKF